MQAHYLVAFHEKGVPQVIGVLLFKVVVLLLFPNKMKCSYTKLYLRKGYLHKKTEKVIITRKQRNLQKVTCTLIFNKIVNILCICTFIFTFYLFDL